MFPNLFRPNAKWNRFYVYWSRLGMFIRAIEGIVGLLNDGKIFVSDAGKFMETFVQQLYFDRQNVIVSLAK